MKDLNKGWGELTLSNYMKNFFGTIGYFFSWIMFYWVFFVFVASIFVGIVWGLLRRLIVPTAV
jgi:hypothetical protein